MLVSSAMVAILTLSTERVVAVLVAAPKMAPEVVLEVVTVTVIVLKAIVAVLTILPS